MMRHRIIQIAAVSFPAQHGATYGDDVPESVTVFALCEDGSLWQREMISGHPAGWAEILSPSVEQRRAAESNVR